MIHRPWKSKTKQSGWSLGWSIFSGFPTGPKGNVWSFKDSLGHHCPFPLPFGGHGKLVAKSNDHPTRGNIRLHVDFLCTYFITFCNCLYMCLFVLRARLTSIFEGHAPNQSLRIWTVFQRHGSSCICKYIIMYPTECILYTIYIHTHAHIAYTHKTYNTYASVFEHVCLLFVFVNLRLLWNTP